MVESCRHNFIEGRGFFVCNQCGLESKEPIIKLIKSFREINSHIITKKYTKTAEINRLMKFNKFYAEYPRFVFNSQQQNFFNAICNEFEISEETKGKTMFYFKKITRRENVTNRIFLIVVCIYQSCKEDKKLFLIKDVLDFTMKLGYSIDRKDIIQYYLKHKKYFKHIRRMSEDYIVSFVDKLINSGGIVDRLRITHNVNSIEAKRIFEKTAFDILKNYPERLRINCTPITFAIATIYVSSLIIKYKFETVELLESFESLKDIGFNTEAARRVYIKQFRQKLLKNKIVPGEYNSF